MRPVHRLTTFAIAAWLVLAVLPLLPPGPPTLHDHANAADGDHTVCVLRLDPRNMHTIVTPPQEFVAARLAGVQPDRFVIVTVNYIGDWPTNARNAFQYAVDIWQTQLTSTVPILVDAEFRSDLGDGVLGSAGAKYMRQDFRGATVSSTWYAGALANKLAETDLETGLVEISSRFSSTFTWYYGTDGATPAGTVDFVSVVLHELCHGLGFSGSARVADGLGLMGFSSYPVIYDWFIENGSAQPILNFTSATPELAAQLQGDSLYWNGSNGVAGAGGSRPRMYAPSTWQQGSSYSHLNEATYPAGNANSLMTYAIGYAEAIHDPGPITRGMFTDMGWTIATGCTFSVAPTTASAASGGGAATVSVTTTAGCTWTAASNAAFLTITGGASGSGSGTVTYNVAANTGQARSGTMTVAGTTVTVNQAVPSSLPTLTPSPSSLTFGAVNSGGTLTAVTPPQTVTVTQSGGTAVAWTARANVSWLTIAAADAAGTGAGSFSVSLNNTGGVLPGSGTLTGTITITAPGAQTNPTIAVRVNTYSLGVTAPPFGQVDTPLQNASGVQGAIGVTGWALDDVGVSNVKIYRNCLGIDNSAGCVTMHGASMVFVGDAAFLAGARPDVEAVFSYYPQAYRGGWGYLMLTNTLPHVTGGRSYGGQGPLTLYAVATDADGRTTLLGRTRLDSTPTWITMANDTITKPFGAIDTPSQGQTVSGVLANFGWVLTPDGDTSAGTGDILVATDGSTMNVVVDGVAIGKVTYNQCRGHVGNPVVTPLFCDDDVANIFGNPTPQPTFTNRTANVTRYRNLDAGRGAIGSFAINTALMTNGLHSIAWGVTDSAGRAEGIGSRNFVVLNAGGDAANPALAPDMTGGWLTANAGAAVGAGSVVGAGAVVGAGSVVGAGAVVGADSVVGAGFSRPLLARTGFDFGAPLEAVSADGDGVHQVQLEELGRLELHVGVVDAGYLVANGTRRDLPSGSFLNRQTGVFTWMPVAGYFGTYRLAFVRTGERVLVDVAVRPARVPEPGESQIRMHLDLPADGQEVDGGFTVAGWALDPQAALGAGIGAVHVWAQRVDALGAAAEFLGVAELGSVRPDVARVFGRQFGAAGFGLTATPLPPGVYDITAYVWNRRTARFEDARTVTVTLRF